MDKDKVVISLHEAAHAISAVYLRLKLRKATIKPKGRRDGYVEVDPSTKIRLFRRNGDGYATVDVEAKKRQFFEKQVIMAFAGFAVDKLYSPARWENSRYSGDRCSIETFRKEGKIPKNELPRLLADAERLVSIPRVQDAIVLTAMRLEHAWKSDAELSPGKIRSIYKRSLQTDPSHLLAVPTGTPR